MAANSIPLDDYLHQSAHDRQEKYETRLIETWPNVTEITSPVFLGSFSWTLTELKQRWLIANAAVNLGHGPQSPTEITRDYLDWKYPKPQRCCSGQYQEIMRHRSFPCWAVAGHHGECAYVDLKSAYWHIMTVIGWDVDYWPGKFMGKKSDVMDFPLQEHKAARSALVSAGLSSSTCMWTGKTLKWKKTRNAHINYGLWACVQDVLHGVASEMLELGAIYVHTDGYILPLENAVKAVQIANEWGFRASIKSTGDTEVYGVGVYRIGEKQTKRYRVQPGTNHENVNPTERDWVKAKFSGWAKKVYPTL